MNKYILGNGLRIFGEFTDEISDALIDPSVVFITITSPFNEDTKLIYGTDAALKRTSAGLYYTDFAPTMKSSPTKDWTYQWTSTGTGASVSSLYKFRVV